MGFMTPISMPEDLREAANPAVTSVFPTPVSVPVMKRPRCFILRNRLGFFAMVKNRIKKLSLRQFMSLLSNKGLKIKSIGVEWGRYHYGRDHRVKGTMEFPPSEADTRKGIWRSGVMEYWNNRNKPRKQRSRSSHLRLA